MKSITLSLVFCVLSLWTQAQSEPIALEYSIGAFKIPANLDRQISERFATLNPNQTYKVTIVGSADYLGSKDNNQVLSNKRVKYAEYHLLQKYRDLRLIIKLDSKGELFSDERAKSAQGVQAHRIVYIYIENYQPSQEYTPMANTSIANNDAFQERTIITAAAATAEGINNVPVSVPQNTTRPINLNTETAQIERENPKASIENNLGNLGTMVETNTTVQTAVDHSGSSLNTSSQNPATPEENGSPESGALNSLNTNNKPKAFDPDGRFAIGDKLLLSDLNFRPGSHYLRPSSIPALRKLITVLEANPTLKIEIIGHICCHPDYSPHPDGYDREAGDNKLSYNRANNIREYLEKNGIDGSRLKATGMGSKERLVYPEETDEDRVTNRRVELKITSL